MSKGCATFVFSYNLLKTQQIYLNGVIVGTEASVGEIYTSKIITRERIDITV
jgi:hypothetical protein